MSTRNAAKTKEEPKEGNKGDISIKDLSNRIDELTKRMDERGKRSDEREKKSDRNMEEIMKQFDLLMRQFEVQEKRNEERIENLAYKTETVKRLEEHVEDIGRRLAEKETEELEEDTNDDHGFLCGRGRNRPGRRERINQQGNTSKLISTLPIFTGQIGTWESFISTFNSITDKLNISQHDKLDFLLISMRDKAAEFKDLLSNRVKSDLQELVRRCEERLGKKEDEITTRR